MATSKSLNPYSNGSYFLTNVANVVTIDTTSLNPYSNGSYFLTAIFIIHCITTLSPETLSKNALAFTIINPFLRVCKVSHYTNTSKNVTANIS